MRNLVHALLLAVALATPVLHAQESKVVEEVDRFTGSTSYTYKTVGYLPGGWPGQLGPTDLMFRGTVHPDGKRSFSMALMAATSTSIRSGSSWRYLRVDHFDWLVNGKPLRTTGASHDGRVNRGFVMEILIQPLTREELEAIAHSEMQVELRVGTDEYRLSAVDGPPLQELLRKMRPAGQ